ncbi:MAG: hypothetical protein HYZ94_03845 [Candidatus Omnitrophica bacterium]|nr:hypothetical protein [Candidatus Omnitrophota bacterium]
MKESRQASSGAPEVKILSEREIQDKLYGGYRRRSIPPPVSDPPTRTTGTGPSAEESRWTGSEILTQELERLRTELISLRAEKDKLALTLHQLSRSAQSVPPAPQQHPQEFVYRAPARPASIWLAKFVAVGIALGAAGYYGISGQILQASPAGGDPAPFTVQAAVYDTRVPAQLAEQFLENLTYGAFLVEIPRKDGRPRYRVCVGSYVTKGEAEMERLRLVGDPRFKYFKDAFVRLR